MIVEEPGPLDARGGPGSARPRGASVPLSSWRHAAALLRLRFRRALNRLASLGIRRKPGAGRRTANPGKANRGLLLAAFFGALLLLVYASFGWQALENLQSALGMEDAVGPAADLDLPPGSPEPVRTLRQAIPPLDGRAFSEGVLKGATLILGLLFVATLLVSLANKELAQPEWDLEWLVTLPVRIPVLLTVRILERSILNFLAVSAMLPFLVAIALRRGMGWTSVPAGIGIGFMILVAVALLQTALEAVFKLRLPPSRIRNIQALLSIVGLVLLYLAMSVGLTIGNRTDLFVYRWASALPAWALWSPPGLAIQALSTTTAAEGLAIAGALALEVVALMALVVGAIGVRLRRGVVSEGVRESGRNARPPRGAAEDAVASGAGRPAAWSRLVLTPVQAKELRLLGRDRSFLVQTLVLPVVIGGFQVLINPKILEGAASAPSHLGAFAFALTAYVLMFSSFQVLNAEGQALWLLYTFPKQLDRIVFEKALLWGTLATVYPVAILTAGAVRSGELSADALGVFAVVLIGIPIYAVIAACLGILGSNPLENELQRRIRPQQAHLYMLLASLYVYGIYASGLRERGILVLLTGLLAFALFQKARDQLPFLLDPVALPPPRVSLADGLIAAQLFFVLQAIATLFAVGALEIPVGPGVLLAFAMAGAATWGSLRLSFWRNRMQGVPVWLGPWPQRGVFFGGLFGVAAAAIGIGYLFLRRGDAALEALRSQPGALADNAVWVIPIAVVLAPLFEEFIFRGLIFGRLRRSLGVWTSALASAAIFAVAHPAFSGPPVFVLGVFAALAYEASGMLLGPAIAHAVYNAAMIGAQFL